MSGVNTERETNTDPIWAFDFGFVRAKPSDAKSARLLLICEDKVSASGRRDAEIFRMLEIIKG